MFKRLQYFLLILLINIDALTQSLIWGLIYVIKGGTAPSWDETISSHVGRKALEGRKWALIAQSGINFIFGLLGQQDHCYHAIEILSTDKYPRQG